MLLVLQIALLVALTRSFARAAKAKGRSRAWGALTVALWLLGEAAGLAFSVGGDASAGVLYSIMGGMAGGLASWLVIALLPAKPIEPAKPAASRFDAQNPYSPPEHD